MGEFLFSDFSLRDDHCGQKVCSDAVLFAAWAWDGKPTEGHVLDIGSGSGVLALLTARACPETEVTAIELSPEACRDARINFEGSPWSKRLTLFEGSFEDFRPALPPAAIICNPPFFAGGAIAPDAARAGARHEGSLSYGSVIEYASRILQEDGRLLLLGPDDRSDDVVFSAELKGFKLRRHARVQTSPRKAPTRSFWEFRRQDGECINETIQIRDRSGAYSREYLRLVEGLYHHLA